MASYTLKNEEITTGSFIFDAIMNNGIDSKNDGAAIILRELKGNLTQNDIINIVRKALDVELIIRAGAQRLPGE